MGISHPVPGFTFLHFQTDGEKLLLHLAFLGHTTAKNSIPYVRASFSAGKRAKM